ncbi:MAG: multiubiquitin domain-containing protein [Vicinamibacterales bacterium]
MSDPVEQDLPSDDSSEKGQSTPRYQIQIDRVHYTVEQASLTGAELRALVNPPVGPDRDLFEVVPGGTDRKIDASDVVQMRNGLRFFTAPSHINPGGAR